jgi:hypothetical protein
VYPLNQNGHLIFEQEPRQSLGYNALEAKAGLDAVELAKEFGGYPLRLGEFDEPV